MKDKSSVLLWTIATPLIGMSVVCMTFLVVRALSADNLRYWFLPWNLFLAWLPFGFAFLLRELLRKNRWLSWRSLFVTVLWLAFLPNSFYVLTDLIHIHETGEVSVLFDVVMMSLFSITGLLLGFVSLLLVQRELEKRLHTRRVTGVLLLVILLCSFAIYLGRYLRWNSWDIIGNPLGLLFDVTDRIANPVGHPMTFTTTAMFFVFISSVYFGLLQLVKALKPLLK